MTLGKLWLWQHVAEPIRNLLGACPLPAPQSSCGAQALLLAKLNLITWAFSLCPKSLPDLLQLWGQAWGAENVAISS